MSSRSPAEDENRHDAKSDLNKSLRSRPMLRSSFQRCKCSCGSNVLNDLNGLNPIMRRLTHRTRSAKPSYSQIP